MKVYRKIVFLGADATLAGATLGLRRTTAAAVAAVTALLAGGATEATGVDKGAEGAVTMSRPATSTSCH